MNFVVLALQFILAVVAVMGIVFLWAVFGVLLWVKRHGRSMPDVPLDDEPTSK